MLTSASSASERQTYFRQVVALAAGIGLTLLAVFLACLFQLPVTCASTTTIMIGASSICLDGIFIWFAWWRTQALNSFETDTMLQSKDAQLMRRIAFLATGSVAAPLALNTVAAFFLLYRWSELVDWGRLMSCRPNLFLMLLLLLSVSNAEVLQLIPWCERDLNGFPTATTVSLSAAGVLIGDVLQIGLQTYFMMVLASEELILGGDEQQQQQHRGHRHLLNYAFGLALLCSGLAVVSLWSRGLRKLIILFCTRKAPQVDEQFWAASHARHFSAASAHMRTVFVDHMRKQLGTGTGTLPNEPSSAAMSTMPPHVLSQVATADPPQSVATRPRPAPRGTALQWLTEHEESPSERGRAQVTQRMPPKGSVNKSRENIWSSSSDMRL